MNQQAFPLNGNEVAASSTLPSSNELALQRARNDLKVATDHLLLAVKMMRNCDLKLEELERITASRREKIQPTAPTSSKDRPTVPTSQPLTGKQAVERAQERMKALGTVGKPIRHTKEEDALTSTRDTGSGATPPWPTIETRSPSSGEGFSGVRTHRARGKWGAS